MIERLSDERILELVDHSKVLWTDQSKILTKQDLVAIFSELLGLRAENKKMRARCTWLQGRRKALQAIAAKRMVRMRALRRMRSKLADGPVMPEVPSDAVVHVAFASADIPPEDIDDEARGHFDVFWRDIRAALLKEQRTPSASDELPTAEAIPTPENAANREVPAEHKVAAS